ncbi:hypothetical protein [Nocardia carnea]|uniref:hypothetical protein n=1 Tax=Nocardia carnea TaxID=37328 RepID=UPI002458201A|nr:hypothetical protein [Nocardia carnea]
MRILVRTLCACGAALALVCTAPTATTQPPGTAGAAAGDTEFSARDLGLGDPITLRGDDDEVQLAIPVPPGTTPTELTMAVDLPADLARGTIDVESGQRFIAHADLPPGPATRVPVTLPLDEASVDEQAATLTLHVNLFPAEGRCPDDWFDHGAVLRDIRTTYAGTPEPPAVIADFLPPILQELRVYVPDTPSDLESTAALSLSTAIVAHYGSQPVRVSLRKLAPDGSVTEPDDPFTRSVAIRAGGDPATTLTQTAGIPFLLVTGDGEPLLDQVRLITSRVAEFAVGSRAVAGSLDQAPILAPDTTTLGALGVGRLSASSHAEVSVRFSLDQSRLGRPTGHIRVKLQGHYTPLPPSQAGQLVVTAGERELANWAADSSGQIDRWIDIPDDVLQRSTPVQVTLRTTGDTGRCGTDQPLTMTVLPGSEVTGEAAPGGPPRGFQALPQGLLPGVEVAATAGGFDDLRRAVAVTTGLQSLTTTRLDPRWTPVSEVAGGTRPALLIAADGRTPGGISPPLGKTDETRLQLTERDGKTTQLQLSPDLRFASLQSYYDGKRQLLVAASNAGPGELDRTLDWLADRPDGWYSLSGDVLFTAAGREPVDYSLPAPDSAAGPEATVSATMRTVLVVAAVLLVIGLVVALWFAARGRRRTNRR